MGQQSVSEWGRGTKGATGWRDGISKVLVPEVEESRSAGRER